MSKLNFRDYDIIRKPIITEKSQASAGHSQYFFEVRKDATKPEIKKAIAAIFNVEVKTVNTLVRKGKTRRFKGRVGMQSDKKIAMISLKPGQVIELGVGV